LKSALAGGMPCICRTLIAFVIFLGICSAAMADSLNSFRRAHGLPALHRSASLQAMAPRHARGMAARQSMDHNCFYSDRGPKGALAENVAWGCAPCECGKILQDIARTCCCPTSKTTAWRRPRVDERGIGALSSADSDAQNVNNLFTAVHAT
jgi:hypothetical protein